MPTEKELEQQIKVLEQRLSAYEQPGAIGFYYELNRWLNETVKLMRSKNISTMMGAGKEDKEFDRMMALIKQGKENIDALQGIKQIIGISGDEEKDKAAYKQRSTTPESIAESFGDNKSTDV